MVTFAQAQERAERWVNGAAGEPPQEVRVREFDLGFVAWAEDSGGAPVSGGKLVIARDSGDTTLWPALPVGEVIRQYEDEYGTISAPSDDASGEDKVPVDLEATSFLLTPPQWLQEAADRAGIPDQRSGAREPGPAMPATTPASSGAAAPDSSAAPSPWKDTSGSGAGTPSVAPPVTVFSASVEEPPAGPQSAGTSEARTTFLPQGSALPKTTVSPSVPEPVPPGGPGGGDLADAATAKATGSAAGTGTPARSGGLGIPVPPPPGAPGTPGAGHAPSRDDTGSGASGYVPTQMVSADALKAQLGGGKPEGGTGPDPGGTAHQAATMLAGSPVKSPEVGPPPPPGAAPRTPPPGGDSSAHQAATVLSAPAVGAGPAQQPTTPPPPGAGTPPPGGQLAGTPPPGGQGSYGYPPQPDQPTVGSGYMAVLRFRGPDGAEQQLIRRSAPGLPHPEWQILHELYAMNVPPQQVLELHTELQSCELPGGYCARMIRESWPQVRISHTAAYGQEHASRQAGVRHLVEHQDELHQVADAPPRAAPVRAPLPAQQSAPAVGLDVIGQELLQAYGPQGVFRYDQQAVSRAGVPEIVAHTLVWSGLPLDASPLFWAQAQPGRPVPTLAELATERGVQPAPDAGSYLVMGSDFGRQLCVQYGTAHIVAVPLEAGPGGQVVAPRFVNASLPQFVRCLALLGRMWRLRYGLNPEQAGRWTTDFQQQLGSLDAQALADPESWWSVLLEQMWDGLL